MNPLVAQLSHLPFPDLAATLREGADEITRAWDAAVREAMPHMQHLTFEQLKDSTPAILTAIADALASDDPDEIRELVSRAPAQGQSRFQLDLDVLDVMQEDRLLRATIVKHVEAGLGRQMDVAESAALHATIDIMLQRSVVALVDEQKAQLRAAAETELKFLSFLSHDLNGKLNTINLWLRVLEGELNTKGGRADAVDYLGQARQSIGETVSGMRQMLDHERLRKGGERPAFSTVNLHSLAMRVAGQCGADAAAKGVNVAVDVRPDTLVESEADLISMVLLNLVGNAVKYSTAGIVRIGSHTRTERLTVWVSDQGPGIAPAMRGRIFDAFRRGEVHGQPGVGLGLAIASHAAKLLDAELTIESDLGVGSTFRLTFPRRVAG